MRHPTLYLPAIMPSPRAEAGPSEKSRKMLSVSLAPSSGQNTLPGPYVVLQRGQIIDAGVEFDSFDEDMGRGWLWALVFYAMVQWYWWSVDNTRFRVRGGIDSAISFALRAC